MNLVVVSIFDLAAQSYGRPVFIPSQGLAIRSFSDEVNKPDGGDLHNHPEDFVLYELGGFDDNTGRFNLHDDRRFSSLGRMLSLRRFVTKLSISLWSLSPSRERVHQKLWAILSLGGYMFRNRSVDVHQFAMIPRADIPRSSFSMQKNYKTTFDGGYLVPVFCEEVLPGDSFNVNMTAFARMATPLYPLMDNLHLDSFFFFVPNRLVWSNWKKFMGEQASPGDSISYTIPQQVCPAGGYAIGSLQDYLGLPTVGQVGAGNTVSHSALPLRAYNLIWQEWFRDENLQNAVTLDTGNGPDTVTNYTLLRRGKRHDYFTGALPWPQKGSTAVSLPLGTSRLLRGFLMLVPGIRMIWAPILLPVLVLCLSLLLVGSSARLVFRLIRMVA